MHHSVRYKCLVATLLLAAFVMASSVHAQLELKASNGTTVLLRVLQSGDVGIGLNASNPQRKLHVNGTVRLQNVGNPATGTTNRIAVLDQSDGDLTALPVGATNQYLRSDLSWQSIPGYWNLNGADLYPTSTSYYVGVGTTNPTVPLQVKGGVRIEDLPTPVGTGNRVLQADADGDLAALAVGSTEQFLRGDGAWATPPTGTNYWRLNGSDLFPINTSYDVGIGTTNPDADFVVQNDADNAIIRIRTNSTSNEDKPALLLDRETNTQISSIRFTTNNTTNWTIGQLSGTLGNVAEDLVISTSDLSNYAKFYISRNKGNIGVGTTNPLAALHVPRLAGPENVPPYPTDASIGILSNGMPSATASGIFLNVYATTRVSNASVTGGTQRQAVNGDIVNGNSEWLAAGTFAYQRNDAATGGIHYISAVTGAVNNNIPLGSYPSNHMRYAAYFYNDFSDEATDKALCVTGNVLVQSGYTVTAPYPTSRFRLVNRTTTDGSMQGCLNLGADDYAALFREGNALKLANISGGEIHVTTGGAAGMIHFQSATGTSGNYQFDNLPSGSHTALHVDGNGRLYKYSSSARYKEAIQNFNEDFDKILQVQPKSFRYKDSGVASFGYIAEELEQSGLKNLVVYNDKGQPESVAYDKVALYLAEVIKEMKKELDELKLRK